MMTELCAARPVGVLGAVDETEQVAFIEVLESVHLVDHGDVGAQPLHDLTRELEAKIHLRGPDVKEQVARRGHGVVLVADDRGKRMQLGRAGSAEQPVPRCRTHPGDAGELAIG